jgi:tRNA A-37 threonylcarbamoyl transferase component Bud32
MRPLRHGYTNDTQGDGIEVVKRYEGPDSDVRRQRECAMLDRLRGRLPVAPLLQDVEPGTLRMGFVPGVHGQDLIQDGHAVPVLRACGQVLRQIHGADVTQAFPHESHPPDTVLIHGDFGPNNVLVDPSTFTVTAVLDWEWARPGRAVEDLAWCEWIVRMHHREHVEALAGFFDAYGQCPTWRQRQDAMAAQCQLLLDVSRRWTPDGVRLWQSRLEETTAWSE